MLSCNLTATLGRIPLFALVGLAVGFATGEARSAEYVIRTVALAGDDAPGTFDASFREFRRFGKLPSINEFGDTAFFAVTTDSKIGIWKEQPDLTLVTLSGEIAPDTFGLKFDFARFGAGPAFNNQGKTAFFARLTTGASYPPPEDSLWKEEPSLTFTLVAREGDIAPESSGQIFSGVGMPSLNDAGNTAFFASLSGGEIGSGIWKESPSLLPVVLEDDPAPGTLGASFSGFSSFGGVIPLNEHGNTAFRADIVGGDATGANNQGIWKENPDLTLVVRKGEAAPGVQGATFKYFGTFGGYSATPALNDTGDVAFFADLSNRQHGIWKESPDLTLVALEDDPAPGTIDASFLSFANFSTGPALNDIGRAAFFGFLKGPAVTSNNDTGIWAEDEVSGLLDLVVREGDELEVGPGEFRTVSLVTFDQSGFNDLGEIAFVAEFTDNTQGVFVATPVLPSEIELLDILADAVIDLGLSKGAEKALLDKLKAALNKLDDGNPQNDPAASSILGDFIAIVDAKRGKAIAEEDAASLTALAKLIITLLELA